MNLDDLIKQFDGNIEGLMTALSDGRLTAQGFITEFEASIARYHIAALMTGQQTAELSEQAADALVNLLAVQLGFVAGFARLLKALGPVGIGDRMGKLMWRAKLYAKAIKSSWWHGDMILKTGRVWPVAAVPGQGTQCGSNCNCELRYDVFDAKKGDADIYWELEAGSQHCQSCLVRSREWYPMKIRDGVLLQ